MNWDKSILKFVSEYDLVLVDTNFFDVITDGTNSNLCEKLYVTKQLNELEIYEERLETFHEDLMWKFDGFVISDNVFTVHGVSEELEKFRNNLNETYKWQNKNFKEDKKKYDVRSRFNHKPSIKKRNKFLEEDELDKSNYYREPKALIFLNCVVNDLCKIIKNLKVYDKVIMDFSIKIHEASEADYGLVGAAFDYHEKNNKSKISIISNDEHIGQIRNENGLEKCFDVITLSNYKKFLENLSN